MARAFRRPFSKLIPFFALGFVALVALAVSRPAYAVASTSTPSGYTLQGRLTDSNGNPITATVGLILDIYSPDGTCLLYEEAQTGIDLSGTNGDFAVILGSNVGDTKRTGNDPGLSLPEIFENSGSELQAAGANCTNAYTPQPGDQRGIRISVVNGGPPVPLGPDEAIAAVPYATVAETLQGLAPGAFIQATGTVSQNSLSLLTGGGTQAEMQVATSAAATPGILLQGSAGQTADLLEIENSIGTPLVTIDAQGDLALLNSSSAQAGTNVGSAAFALEGSYWTGIFASGDAWTVQDSLGTGSNPTSTLQISHTGSPGGATLSIGSNVAISGSGTYTGTWTQSSDARFKKNVHTIDDALDKVLALRGVSYELRCDEFPAKQFPSGTQLGFIAQEVESVLPEVVRTDAEGYKSVAYQNLTAVLVEAVKASSAQVQALTGQVAALQSENAALERDVQALKRATCAAGAAASFCQGAD